MRVGPASSTRWLRLCVAVLALLCGSGAHDLLHAGDGPRDARPTSPLEVHGAGCEHLGDEVPHDAGSCLLCKAGSPHALAARGAAAHREPSLPRSLADGGGPMRVHAPGMAGALGARAPPVMVG